MLFDNFLVGSGPDGFIIDYPNDDDIGRLNAFGSTILIEKPHNMFLQIGINTGLVTLFAFLGINFLYIIQSLKLYIKSKFKEPLEVIGAALMIGVMAYLVTGLINDQIISVAPIYYGALGLGFAINRICELNMNKKIDL